MGFKENKDFSRSFFLPVGFKKKKKIPASLFFLPIGFRTVHSKGSRVFTKTGLTT